jgi:hypothetical protein
MDRSSTPTSPGATEFAPGLFLCRRERAAGALRMATMVLRLVECGENVKPSLVRSAIDGLAELQVSIQ